MSKHISDKTVEKLTFIVGNKATILLKPTIARIFTASPDELWKDTGLLGFLCLVFDRSTKSPYFRLFEIDTCELTFEMELYYNFSDSYKEDLSGFFYYFEVKNGFIGLSIQDKEDANSLKQKILNISPKGDAKALQEASKAKGNETKKPVKKKKGFLKKMWGKITGNSDSDEPFDISGPTEVRHESSIKFDTKKGTFDVKNMPSEWKTLFKKAGVEKKHLLDNEYAPMIMEVVLNAYSDQEKAETFASQNNGSQTSVPTGIQPQNSSAGGPQGHAGGSAVGGGPQAPVLNLGGGGGGPPAPVLNLGGGAAGGGGGPPAPVLNLGGAGGGGGPPAPVLNLGGGGGGPPAPVLNLGGGGGGPPAPVLNLGGGGGGPPAPVLNLGGGGGSGPPAPVLNLAGGPSAPNLNLPGPSGFKPAANAGPKGQAASANLPKPSADRGDLLAQINSGGFKLKKVQKDEKKNVVAVDIKNMPKKVEESLTNTLAAAIAERRKQLMKNNYKEKETSDWSD